jgi:hypothetical protein
MYRSHLGATTALEIGLLLMQPLFRCSISRFRNMATVSGEQRLHVWSEVAKGLWASRPVYQHCALRASNYKQLQALSRGQ